MPHTPECLSGNIGPQWSGSPNPANPDNEWLCDECGGIIAESDQRNTTMKEIASFAPRWVEPKANEDTGHFVIQADGTDAMLAAVQAALPPGASAEYHDSGETILVYPALTAL